MALFNCGCCNPALSGLFKLGQAREFTRREAFVATAVTAAGVAIAPALAKAATADGMFALPAALLRNGPADLIIIGDIVTVADGQPTAEALAMTQGRIVAIGGVKEVMSRKGPNTGVVDWTGKAVLPGFVDPHVHVVSSSLFNLFLDLSPFANKDADEVLAKIGAAATKAKPGEWVIGQLYDTALMPGHRELVRDDLDKVAPNNPVFVLSASQHFGYTNSKALEAAGIPEHIVDPSGGKFMRDAKGRLNGVLSEAPAILAVGTKLPHPAPKDVIGATAATFKAASAAGCTSLHEIALGILAGATELSIIGEGLKASDRPVRVGGQIFYDKLEEIRAIPGMVQGGANDFFRVTAVKLVSDGSNQGLTGFLREPYKGGGDNRGAANYSQEELNAIATKLNADGWRLSIHANGDAAVDMVITAIETAMAHTPRVDARPRIEHCSLVHDEQMARIAKAGISPSFLMNHVYYFGRYFRDEIMGLERANLLDPCNSAIRHGVRFAFHSDYSVTNILPLLSMQTAVTRRMRDGGEVLAPDERITPAQALRAVTIDAAWQCGFEEEIGSLEVGKYADIVVLDKNPLTIDPDSIGSIKVLETYVGGERKFAG
jgi:predicted amidohydrolase YtcJ